MTTKHIAYRPSNGTEGDCFQARWCAKCEREAGYRLDETRFDGCDILVAAYALSIGHPEYPPEWRKDGPQGPRCTAFIPEGEDVEKYTPLDPGAVLRPLI